MDQERVRLRPADRPGDLGWMMLAHGEIYAEQLGWSTEFEAMVAAIVAEYAAGHDPEREGAWIAEVDGERAGCVSLVADPSPRTARLRILLVAPAARGLGVGSLLVDTCLDLARRAGYERVTLWTVAGLDSARRIYQAAGFVLVEEEPQHRFGHDVVGQTWTLELGRNTLS